jgi:hypothetical protein
MKMRKTYFALGLTVLIGITGCTSQPPKEPVSQNTTQKSSTDLDADSAHHLLSQPNINAERSNLILQASSNGTDISIKGANGQQSTLLISGLPDVYIDHIAAAAYHQRSLFVIRRIGDTSGNDWSDELWEYTNEGGQKLYAAKGLSFTASPAGNLVAIDASDEVTIMNTLSGEVVKKLMLSDFDQAKVQQNEKQYDSNASVQAWQWSSDGTSLWGTVNIRDPFLFFRLSAADWKLEQFPVPPDYGFEYALNPDSGLIAYSTYPLILDVEGKEEFESQKTPVMFYLYDFKNGTQKKVATSVTKKFEPEWTNSNTLSYDDPKGQGKKELNVSQ